MREKIVKLLGNKCSICEYDKFIPALQIHGPDTAERRRNKNRYKYYWELYDHIQEHGVTGYYLLCANCTIQQRITQATQPASTASTEASGAVWAWCTDYTDGANRTNATIEERMQSGDKVYLVDLQTNRVYCYPPPTVEVAEDWDSFAKQHGYKQQLWYGLQVVSTTDRVMEET